MRRPILLAALLTLAVQPAAAQGPVGIAAVNAPEWAYGECTGNNPDEAFDCARERCMAELRERGFPGEVRPQECQRTAWCYPAGWSGYIASTHVAGIHGSTFVCGWPSRAALETAAGVWCEEGGAYLIECELAVIFDPDGARVHGSD